MPSNENSKEQPPQKLDNEAWARLCQEASQHAEANQKEKPTPMPRTREEEIQARLD